MLRIDGRDRRDMFTLNRNGQLFAFILALIAMGLSTYLIYLDKDIAGGVFGTTALIVLISLFIRGKTSREPEK